MTNIFLDNLDQLIAFITAAIVVANLVIFRRLNTCGIAAVGFAIVQSLSVLVTGPIRESLFSYSPQLSLVVFYFTFAFIDLIAIVVIYRIHNTLDVVIGASSNFVVRSLQLLALLQIARFVDRKLEFELLGTAYQYMVPAMNFAILAVLSFFTVKNYLNSRNMAGLKGI